MPLLDAQWLEAVRNGVKLWQQLKIRWLPRFAAVVSEWATDAVAPKRPAISKLQKVPRLE